MDSERITNKEDFLVVRDIQICFDDIVLENVSFSLGRGEVIAIVGVSGCGKTTILRAIAGLQKLSKGGVSFVSSKQPNIGMIFQASALFPWMTVRQNIEVSERMQSLDKDTRDKEAHKIAQSVGLGSCLDTYPASLSGGMAQRAEIARALAAHHELLLMDEPFSKLDIQTRHAMYEVFSRTVLESDMTVILVTHSIQEALLLADRILVVTGSPAHTEAQFTNPLPHPRTRDMLRGLEIETTICEIEEKLQKDYKERGLPH